MPTSRHRTVALSALWRLGARCLLLLALGFTAQSVRAQTCSLPANWPSGLPGSCQCDSFNRASLNPSTIFSSNWIATTSDTTGLLPRIVNSGYLRLTDNTGQNAKSATVPAAYPAAGNYISVEFRHYAYNGSGADGMTMVLSDYAVPAQPGAPGGSLGYAQNASQVGFAGGWIGIAFDEFGNYQNPTENRVGGPGFIAESVGVRGSGSGSSGYAWLTGTNSLTGSNTIDNRTSTSPSRGYLYQVIVDARNYTSSNRTALFAINRDTTATGNSYASFVAQFDVFARASSLGVSQSNVPTNWQISFTGSTGGSTNIHEIGALKICAQSADPPTGGALGGFNAIDSTYVRGNVNALQGHLFTKLAGTAFQLDIAALNSSSSGISSNYVLTGTKTVAISLIDDSAGTSCNASASACTACSKPVIATQNLVFNSSDQGYKTSGNFTVNGAYSRVIAKMTDGTATGCSTDAFSIRPTSVSAVSATASNAALTGTPVFKAGTDAFTMTATVPVTGYTGTLKLNTTYLQALPTGATAGALNPLSFTAATSGAGSSTATTSFTYSEAGAFKLLGTGSNHALYDDSWTTVDQGSAGDCVAGSYSNAVDSSGKFGCLFGITADTATMGRFTASKFAVTSSALTAACTASGKTAFTYMGQPFASLAVTVQAQNGAGIVLANYDSALLSSLAGVSWVAEDSNSGTNLGSRMSVPAPSKTWNAGQYVVSTSAASFARAASPDGSFENLQLGVAVSDPDGALLSNADFNPAGTGACSGTGCTAKAVGGTTALRFGRLALTNAYGWEKLRLPVALQAQYWNGSDFILNGDDSCTQFAATDFVLSGFTGLAACDTAFTASNSAKLTSGAGQLVFAAPNKTGSLTVSPTLGSVASGTTCTGSLPTSAAAATAASKTWLQGRWKGSATYTANPAAKVAFGLHRGSDKIIQIREFY